MRRASNPSLLFHLAPSEVCLADWVTPVAGALLPSPFHPSPDLDCSSHRRVCSLLHLFADYSDQPLAGALLYGVPTFLSRLASTAAARLTITAWYDSLLLVTSPARKDSNLHIPMCSGALPLEQRAAPRSLPVSRCLAVRQNRTATGWSVPWVVMTFSANRVMSPFAPWGNHVHGHHLRRKQDLNLRWVSPNLFSKQAPSAARTLLHWYCVQHAASG